MNVLDLLIIIALLGGLIHGFSSGVIKQVASVVGIVAGVLIGLKFMHPVGETLVEFTGISQRLVAVAGFAAVFLAIHVGVFAIVKLVEAVTGALKLTAVNRILGAAFGMGKAAIGASLVLVLLGHIGIPSKSWTEKSLLYDPVYSSFPLAWDFAAERLPQLENISERFVRVGEQGESETSPPDASGTGNK